MSYLTQTPSGINFTQGTFNHLRAFSLDQDSLFSFYLVIVLKVEMGSHYGAQGNLSYIWEQQSSCLSWSCSHASGCPGHSLLYFFTFENLVRETSSREPLAVACQLGWHVMAQLPWCLFFPSSVLYCAKGSCRPKCHCSQVALQPCLLLSILNTPTYVSWIHF